jgi:hypothetical protein
LMSGGITVLRHLLRTRRHPSMFLISEAKGPVV